MMKKNSVFIGDINDFLSKIEDNSVDLIVADPPYNQNIDKWDIFKTENDYFDFMYSWLDLAIRKLSPKGSIYLFNNAYNSAFIMSYLVKKGLFFKNWIIWYKKDGFSPSRTKFVNNQETVLFFTKSKNNYTFNFEAIRVPYSSESRMKAAEKTGILKNNKRWYPNPNGKLCTDVWEFSSVRLKNKVNGRTIKTNHPTPKPKDMIKRIISASTNENDLVLDLFSGSGITSIVCLEMNRNFLACEKNELYAKEIIEKLNKIK